MNVRLFRSNNTTFCAPSGLLVIEAHEQNTAGLKFKVPLVPYVPALSILCNVELMANLNFLTWIRFILWMAIGKDKCTPAAARLY